ncbi:MAG: hypothetical protein MPL62_02955 [Alphaproteobacteria bacterium]|nr:hypothetical protein [Alphaproteobacteria bacterium]
MRNHPRLNRRRRLVARLRNRRAEVGRKSEGGEIILVRLLGVSDFCDGSSPFNVCPDCDGNILLSKRLASDASSCAII